MACSRHSVSSVSGHAGITCYATATASDVFIPWGMASGWLATKDEDSSCLEWKPRADARICERIWPAHAAAEACWKSTLGFRVKLKPFSPLVDRLMRLMEGSHCITGEEHAVELALREALSNAVVHGNLLDAHKLVHVRCRCKVGKEISLIVSHQGQEFDAHNVPDSVAAENLEAEHGRGIRLMKSAMDEVCFQQRSTEIHMRRRLARNERAGVRD